MFPFVLFFFSFVLFGLACILPQTQKMSKKNFYAFNQQRLDAFKVSNEKIQEALNIKVQKVENPDNYPIFRKQGLYGTRSALMFLNETKVSKIFRSISHRLPKHLLEPVPPGCEVTKKNCFKIRFYLHTTNLKKKT